MPNWTTVTFFKDYLQTISNDVFTVIDTLDLINSKLDSIDSKFVNPLPVDQV